MSYRVLVLPRGRDDDAALLRKIKELVEAGATVIGPPPVKSPSLQRLSRSATTRSGAGRGALGRGQTARGGQPSAASARAGSSGAASLHGRRPDAGADRIARLPSSAKWIWRKEGNPAVAVPPGKRYFRRRQCRRVTRATRQAALSRRGW